MTRVDPLVAMVLSDLARGLRALEIDFCVIGSLVPELLLGVTPRRLTNDADAIVTLTTIIDDLGLTMMERASRLNTPAPTSSARMPDAFVIGPLSVRLA